MNAAPRFARPRPPPNSNKERLRRTYETFNNKERRSTGLRSPHFFVLHDLQALGFVLLLQLVCAASPPPVDAARRETIR